MCNLITAQFFLGYVWIGGKEMEVHHLLKLLLPFLIALTSVHSFAISCSYYIRSNATKVNIS